MRDRDILIIGRWKWQKQSAENCEKTVDKRIGNRYNSDMRVQDK